MSVFMSGILITFIGMSAVYAFLSILAYLIYVCGRLFSYTQKNSKEKIALAIVIASQKGEK